MERQVGLLIQLLAIEQRSARKPPAGSDTPLPPPSICLWDCFGLGRVEWEEAWAGAPGGGAASAAEDCSALEARFLSDKRLARKLIALTSRASAAAAAGGPAAGAAGTVPAAASFVFSELEAASFVFSEQQMSPTAVPKHGRRRRPEQKAGGGA